jgi:hypothetical protein
MNTAIDTTKMVDDLAGYWTDLALSISRAAGIERVGVEMEIETWRTLKNLLESEVARGHSPWFSTLLSQGSLMHRVLGKAVVWVALKLQPQAVSRQFKNRVAWLARQAGPSAVERRLSSAIAKLQAASEFEAPVPASRGSRLQAAACGL